MSFLIKLAIFVAIYSIFHMFILRPYIAGGVCTSKARLEGKTVIVTGANTGIGKETAEDLAKRGARVILACRNLQKANKAMSDIIEKTGNKNIVAKRFDLASLASVREFAKDIIQNEDRLDVLINNAGVAQFPNLTMTEDGFETQMGVNHLGHFLLTNLLLDLLKKSAPSRIVVVSSSAHWVMTKDFNFENMNGEKFYHRADAYGQSKLANILFTRELAKRLQGSGVTANSLHPGAIATELGRHFPRYLLVLISSIAPYFVKTPKEGAQTNIYLAVSEEVDGVTGLYFADCKEKIPAVTAQDDDVAKKLWAVSAKLVGLNDEV
ncbi:retinol dehydrogenase 13-like [Xenia sp. Carnegie-2017]|uniref:retinol dehydrogenase 13-like n=1 Tax=Xenia sp. Carnegie-2017 TaxID=2897299 RepID=UPI001F045B8E|nr:retinol dehydrogenase 13-like [Xenia sp. Carnegie-2017]